MKLDRGRRLPQQFVFILKRLNPAQATAFGLLRAKIEYVRAGTSIVLVRRNDPQLYPIGKTHLNPQETRFDAILNILLDLFLIVAVTDLKQIDRNFREGRNRLSRVAGVPQIWLTYSEFAALVNCAPAEARKVSIAAGLDRRKSRDGVTRVKLTQPLADVFLDIVMRQFLEREMTASAGQLRALHERMARPFAQAERLTG